MINISEYLINKQTKEQVNKYDEIFELVKKLHDQGYDDGIYINDNIKIDYAPIVYYKKLDNPKDEELELLYFIYDSENDTVHVGVYSLDEAQEVEYDLYDIIILDEDLQELIKCIKKI